MHTYLNNSKMAREMKGQALQFNSQRWDEEVFLLLLNTLCCNSRNSISLFKENKQFQQPPCRAVVYPKSGCNQGFGFKFKSRKVFHCSAVAGAAFSREFQVREVILKTCFQIEILLGPPCGWISASGKDCLFCVKRGGTCVFYKTQDVLSSWNSRGKWQLDQMRESFQLQGDVF